MLQARVNARLVEETLDEIGVRRGGRQDLDGRHPADLRVNRPVDLTHPARADELDETVVANRLVQQPWCGHGVARDRHMRQASRAYFRTVPTCINSSPYLMGVANAMTVPGIARHAV